LVNRNSSKLKNEQNIHPGEKHIFEILVYFLNNKQDLNEVLRRYDSNKNGELSFKVF
jgi:hypothetical protein